MAGVLFSANGKRVQGGKRYNNQFTNKTCYQTSKIGSDPPVLAGWSVARFFRLYQCSLGIIQWNNGYICPGCFSMAEHMLCHRWPHPNSTMASGTQKAESCRRGRRKYNLVAVQKHSTEWEKGGELPPGPILEIQNCLITGLTEGGKKGLEDRRWMWKESVKQPTVGILSLWTHAKPRSTVLVSLTSFTFTLGRDPRTIWQKEGYLNAMLNATSLLRNLFTVSRVVCIGRAIQETVNDFYFLGKSQFCCHWMKQQ